MTVAGNPHTQNGAKSREVAPRPQAYTLTPQKTGATCPPPKRPYKLMAPTVIPTPLVVRTSKKERRVKTSERAKAPNMEAVSQFWSQAAEEIDQHTGSALFGEQTEAGLFPPVFQYSDNRAEATRMAQEVLEGKRTTFTTPLADFEGPDIAPPADGDMSIICDGEGMPVALISDVDVQIEKDPKDPATKLVVETFEVLFTEAE